MDTPTTPLEPASLALECPECGEFIEPPGNMPPAAALGTHRSRAHGYVSDKPRRKKRAAAKADAPPAESVEGTRPLRLVAEAAGQAKGKGAPTSEQLTKSFAKIYGYSAALIAGAVVDSDPAISTEQERDAVVSMLAPTNDQANTTVRPLARIVAKSKLNGRYGRAIVDNSDVLDMLAAVAEQVQAWRAYLRVRASAQQSPAGFPTPAATGVGGSGVGPPAPTSTPAGPSGILLTGEMLKGQ